MKKKKENLSQDENGQLIHTGFLAWFRNFFYYYKSYVIVAVLLIGTAVALYFSMGSTKPDMFMYVVTDFEISEDTLNSFYDNVNMFVEDIDEDSVKYLEAERILLAHEPQTNAEREEYMALEDAMNNREVVCLAVDEFSYDYLMAEDELRPFDFFGIETEEPYRLRINDSLLFKNVDIDEDMYLVMKYTDDKEYEDYFFSMMTSRVVDMIKKLL